MATIRERRPGVWEIRIFTGRDANGRPTQSSRTFRGSRREAQKLAATLESRAGGKAAGRTVADVLDAWHDANALVWSEASRRSYAGRLALIRKDPIARTSLARLGVADVERWHARMRKASVGEAAIRTRHAALRAALAQAVRWEWITLNPAANARLRQPRRAAREAMNAADVRAVLAAARTIDPLAELGLRFAAVCGARRAEIAALRWDDVRDGRLTIDSSAEEHRFDDGTKDIVDAPTKTGTSRTVRLDQRTLDDVSAHARVRSKVSQYMFSLDDKPAPPARIGWWWTRARDLAGIDRRWRLHDLRHWSATIGITSGHDVRTVAGRLGHANPAMTLRVYAHAVEAADDALATTLGDELDGIADHVPADGRRVGQSPGMDVLARIGADRQAIGEFCARNGIRRLAVFGSALRDDFTPASDVDLLVEFRPGQSVSLFDMARMEMELEEIVRGHRVDLRTAGDLSRRFRDRVVAEAEPVYDTAA